MQISRGLGLAWFSIVFLTATTALAQTPRVNVDIIYTGRLLGYFRVPSLQKIDDVKGCPKITKGSTAAETFRQAREKIGKPGAVLVGTGDNFAPQLEARVFSNVPEDNEKYPIGNKELYFGSATKWVPYRDIERDEYKDLRQTLKEGHGIIPNDNVGCFLRYAKYAAVVPGKHDFYFGAERVRQFARFLATEGDGTEEPVQMLGANLVIKTAPIKPAAVSDSVIANHPLFKDWPSAYPLLNVKDKSAVYPWLSVVKIQLLKMEPETQLLEQLTSLLNADKVIAETDLESFIANHPPLAPNTDEALKKVHEKIDQLKTNWSSIKQHPLNICRAGNDPNALSDDCEPRASQQLRIIDNALVLYAYLKKTFTAGDHFSTLHFGENYFACTEIKDPKSEGKFDKACTRFTVHTPFFYYPHEVPYKKRDGYNDPEPYVVKGDVAIFGVVDPNLGEQVGILNFGWVHDAEKKLTSRVSVEDPADALRQQLDYFEIQRPKFPGLKVLLAQMPPQQARALAARFPEFQVVISAADLDQATTNITATTEWKPGSRAAGTFLAVPTPYFDPLAHKGTVHLGLINAATNDTGWKLSATASPGTSVATPDDAIAKDFWDEIKKLKGCYSEFGRKPEDEKYDNKTYLKWLVLCAMQRYTGADLAMIQTRDLFDQLPQLDETTAENFLNRAKTYENKVPPENVQQMFDRLIWKSDLVTLLQVPGSALKKAFEQSGKYEAAEKSTLALSVETGRKLETLGVRNEGGEYFINDLPLDENRIYTIATTDYIGAGDTGYPDLVKAARNPRTHPAAFNGELAPISSLVCSRYFDDEAQAKRYCLPLVDSETYLDRTTAKTIPTYKPESRFTRLWKATGFAWPDKAKPTDSVDSALEQAVQRRTFWAFSLKNLSFGFSDLDNNDTDKSLNNKFGGIGDSGLTAKGNRTMTLGVDARLSRFADKHELFFGVGIDYNKQSVGDPTSITTQNKNRLYTDIGWVVWRRPGRAVPNFGVVLSGRGETQLENPFASFALNTGRDEDQITIPYKRSLLLLGRVGMRWQSKLNTFEIGGQGGRDMRALQGFRFDNPGQEPVLCVVQSGQTLKKCIEDNSKPPGGLITMTSVANSMVQGRPRAGIYWKHTFSIPFTPRVKYESTQDADFFFVNFHDNTAIDTRFRYNSKHSLKVTVWSFVSIGPTFDILMFQNHSQLDPATLENIGRKFLFQRTFGFETKINFDILNRREKSTQIVSK